MRNVDGGSATARALAVAVFLLPGGVSCGPKTVDVSLRSYRLTASTASIGSSDIAFHVTNDGNDLPHGFVIVATDLAASQLPLVGNRDVDEGHLTIAAELEDLLPRRMREI